MTRDTKRRKKRGELMDLKSLRIKKQLSQEALAKKVGITRPAYTHIESRKRRPSPEVAKKIAAILGFSESWYKLLDYKPSKKCDDELKR